MTKRTDVNQQAQSQEFAGAAIEHTLQKLMTAFHEHDADALSSIYVEDADWTNAFGTTRHGRDAIISYLKGLFADPHFAAGTPVGAPQLAIRFVTDDVALAKTYVEIQGQQTVAGGVLPMRRNHSLKVLSRQSDGRWLIVSEIFMDARDETTYVGS
jgi:uncharacterized protein (TIGR02246 family)